MPVAPENLAKAELIEIEWDEQGQAQEKARGKRFTVQFNPETLNLSYSVQKAGGDTPGGGGMQYVGQGSTKLSLDLWFDVTAPHTEGTGPPATQDTRAFDDVRELTRRVGAFVTPAEDDASTEEKPLFQLPGVRFRWGTFLFEGVMESMTEKIEYFSPDGRPLRASVSVSLSRQDVTLFPPESGAGGSGGPGTTPTVDPPAGQSVQQAAASAGRLDVWHAIAAANDVENPRHLEGRLDLTVGKE